MRPLPYARLVNHNRRAAGMISASLALGMNRKRYNLCTTVALPRMTACKWMEVRRQFPGVAAAMHFMSDRVEYGIFGTRDSLFCANFLRRVINPFDVYFRPANATSSRLVGDYDSQDMRRFLNRLRASFTCRTV